MENTSNYGLKRWDPEDRILHTEFNDNWDKIDTALKGNADGVAALSFFFILRAGEGIVVAVGGGLAVHAQLRRHLHALVLFGERHARPARVGGFVDRAVNGLFAWEERE